MYVNIFDTHDLTKTHISVGMIVWRPIFRVFRLLTRSRILEYKDKFIYNVIYWWASLFPMTLSSFDSNFVWSVAQHFVMRGFYYFLFNTLSKNKNTIQCCSVDVSWTKAIKYRQRFSAHPISYCHMCKCRLFPENARVRMGILGVLLYLSFRWNQIF